MARLAPMLRRIASSPSVIRARHLLERAVTPGLRADTETRHRDVLEAVHAIGVRVDELERRVEAIEECQPPVLNAISSVNGTARLLRRELQAVRDAVERSDARTVEVDVDVDRVDAAAR